MPPLSHRQSVRLGNSIYSSCPRELGWHIGAGEPICLFFPIRRGVLEMFRGEFRMLEADRKFENKFREWSASRDRFLSGLEEGKPEVVAQGWQRDYMQTAKEKKPLAHPFANENAVDQARTGKCVRWSGR